MTSDADVSDKIFCLFFPLSVLKMKLLFTNNCKDLLKYLKSKCATSNSSKKTHKEELFNTLQHKKTEQNLLLQ